MTGYPSFLKHPNFGLLIARLVLGILMVFRGFAKIGGGPEGWQGLGGAVFGKFGIETPIVLIVAGFTAAAVELVGGLLLAIGLWARWAALSLFVIMVGAVASKLPLADGAVWYRVLGHPLELALVFLALAFIGAGRYSLDRQ